MRMLEVTRQWRQKLLSKLLRTASKDLQMERFIPRQYIVYMTMLQVQYIQIARSPVYKNRC